MKEEISLGFEIGLIHYPAYTLADVLPKEPMTEGWNAHLGEGRKQP